MASDPVATSQQVILIDSREKKISHIIRYFELHGIKWRSEKLNVGDYVDPYNPGTIIDRKQNLDEVACNLCSSDSKRFWRELRRAHHNAISLIFLVEHGSGTRSVDDVKEWKSSYSRITGRRLAEEMMKAQLAYGITWEFCDKSETGKRIIELLHHEEEEREK